MRVPYEYYAIVLDEQSHNELRAKFQLNLTALKIFAHHMTIMHRNKHDDSIQEWAEENLGKTFTLKVSSVGSSDLAVAVGVVSEVPCANTQPHVTLATIGRGKPMHSNDIVLWNDREPFEIQGVVTKF